MGVNLWRCCVASLSPLERKPLRNSGRDAYYVRYGKDRDGSGSLEREEEKAAR